MNIRGHVRDENGQPVAGARVWIGGGAHKLLQTTLRGPHYYGTTTDDAGGYMFTNIEPHIEPLIELLGGPSIWAVHPQRGASRMREVPKHDATIDLVLLGMGRIEGRLIGGLQRHRVVAKHREDHGVRATTAGVKGGFVLHDLPPGEYVVEVLDQNSTTVVVVEAGQTTRTELRLVDTLVRLSIKLDSSIPQDGPYHFHHAEGGRVKRMIKVLRMSLNGRPDPVSVSVDVEPGSYKFSADGITWFAIDVAPYPPEQTIHIPAPSSTPKV